MSVLCYDSMGNPLKKLYQWDVNQTILITGLPNLPTVFHFCDTCNEIAYVVTPTAATNGYNVAVPNVLLEKDDPIVLYSYQETGDDAYRTTYLIHIPVIPRSMPEDYIHGDNIEHYTVATVNARISWLINMITGEQTGDYGAEVVDMRTLAEGVEYPVAGDALRAVYLRTITDKSLSHEDEPADAEATGNAIAAITPGAQDGAAALTNEAPEFATNVAYAAGTYVTRNRTLYRFTADHAAGAWTGADAEAVTLGANLSNMAAIFEDSGVKVLSSYPQIKGYVQNGGAWGSSSTAAKTAIIPVSPGDVVEIKGSAISDTIVCVFKSYPTMDLSGGTPPFSTVSGFDARKTVGNTVVTYTMPSDAAYLAITLQTSAITTPQYVKINGVEIANPVREDLASLEQVTEQRTNSLQDSLQDVIDSADILPISSYPTQNGYVSTGQPQSANVDTFSTELDYAVGDHVKYTESGGSEERLYRFIAPHAAGSWIGTDAKDVTSNTKRVWGSIDNNHKTIFVPVQSGDSVEITGYGTVVCAVDTLPVINSTASRYRNVVPFVSDSTWGVRSVLGNTTTGNPTTKRGTMPEDAAYIAIAVYINGDTMPTTLLINGVDYTVTVRRAVELLSLTVNEKHDSLKNDMYESGVLLPNAYPKQQGYINGTKVNDAYVWGGVNSRYQTIFFPVADGDSVNITGSGTVIGVVTELPTIVSGETVPLVNDSTWGTRITLTGSKTGVMPAGSAYIAICVLADNSDTTPTSLLINGVDYAATVRENVASVVASIQTVNERCDELRNEMVSADILPVASFSRENGYISNSTPPTWGSLQTTRTIFIPVAPNDYVELTSSANGATVVGVVSEMPEIASGASVSLVSDPIWGGRISMSAGATKKGYMPAGSAYLSICIYYSPTEYIPTVLVINGVDYTSTIRENLKSLFQSLDGLKTDLYGNYGIALSSVSTQKGVITTGQPESENVSAFSNALDYEVGDHVKRTVDSEEKLYRFITPHAAGEWIGTDAKDVTSNVKRTWGSVTNSYNTIFVPVEPGDSVEITGVGTVIGVVDSLPTINTNSARYHNVVPFVSDSSWGTRTVLGNLSNQTSGTKRGTMPEDAAYIAICVKNNGNDTTPTSLIINGYDHIHTFGVNFKDTIKEVERINNDVIQVDKTLASLNNLEESPSSYWVEGGISVSGGVNTEALADYVIDGVEEFDSNTAYNVGDLVTRTVSETDKRTYQFILPHTAGNSWNTEEVTRLRKNNRIRSRATLADVTDVYVDEGYKYILYAYDDANATTNNGAIAQVSYIGIWNGTSFVNNSTRWLTGKTSLTALGHHYYRIVLAKTDDAPTVFNPAEIHAADKSHCHFIKAASRDIVALPVLNLTGDTSAMTKENSVNLTYRIFGKEGTCSVKWQGSSSLRYPKKNYTIKISKNSDGIDAWTNWTNFKNKYRETTGDSSTGLTVPSPSRWNTQKKFCTKANWIDPSMSRNVVCARLWGQMVKKRIDLEEITAVYSQREIDGQTIEFEDRRLVSPNYGAIDGFPIEIKINGVSAGLYTFNIPKDAWTFAMGDIDEQENYEYVICGEGNGIGATRWTDLAHITEVDDGEGNKSYYFNSDEYSMEYAAQEDDDRPICNSLNGAIAIARTATSNWEALLADYVDVNSVFDYFIFTCCISNHDALARNIIYGTYDGKKWFMSAYDMDTTFGMDPYGRTWLDIKTERTQFAEAAGMHRLAYLMYKYSTQKLINRYRVLRAGILSDENVWHELSNFVVDIPERDYDSDRLIWPDAPGTSTANIHQFMDYYRMHCKYLDEEIDAMIPTFNTGVNYAAGNYVKYNFVTYRFTSAHSAGAWTGEDAIPADSIPFFDETKDYTNGSYVIYGYTLYRFTSAHIASSATGNRLPWTGSDVEVVA